MTRPQVVVIGSGAGGAAFAWALADAGVQVQILEAGPRYDPLKDYLLASNGWEQQGFPAKVPIAGRQTHAPLQLLENRWADLRSWNHLTGHSLASDRRSFLAYNHVIGVGGTTLHFTGESHRMHPQAMQMQSRFDVAADWPFDYAELEPFYVEAERLIGVAGPSDPGVRTRSAPYPLPAHNLSYASQKLGKGCRKLGLSWTANPVASLSRAYDGRPPCNYCGNCTRGCPRLDKGTADLTFIAKALATGNCTITTGAYVLRLLAGSNDRVKSVVYGSTRRQHRVEADYFAVACGAVETPRLLLNSSPAGSSDGLANESGLVGRNFMETLFWTSAGLHPEPLGSHRGLPSDAICWDYNAPDAIPGVVGGCRFSPSTAEADLIGPINYARRVVGGWGRSHKTSMREQFGRMLAVGGIGEHLPDERSFIDLDPNEKDAFDLPKARIHSHLAATEIERLDFIAKTCRRILAAAGVKKVIEEYGSYDAFNATHVFGTCRMGTEAKTSVVDSSCRSHRWRNLLVTDASVFPSSGGGESPALTISAIALRAARKLLHSI
ncbi:MAG: GMC family oxidoreductase [Proteobacteria bacterium]|nr:GMC family oxidoreductase [Pseudomonadota bacterium]